MKLGSSIMKKINKLSEYYRKGEDEKLDEILMKLDNYFLKNKKMSGIFTKKATKLDNFEEEKQYYLKEKNILYNNLKFEFKKTLSLKKSIKSIKISILLRMNDYQIDETKKIIMNLILKRYILEFTNLNNNLKSLKNIRNSFLTLVEILEKIRLTNKLPKNWNLEGEFMFYAIIHLKELLFETYYSNKWTEEEYLETIKIIIDFEKKYTRYFFKKDCCLSKLNKNIQNIENETEIQTNNLLEDRPYLNSRNDHENIENNTQKNECTKIIKHNKSICRHLFSKNVILFDRDEVDLKNISTTTSNTSPKLPKSNLFILYHKPTLKDLEFCRHKKMLSNLLLPEIHIYVNQLFQDQEDGKGLNSITLGNKIEMNLNKTILNFFSQIGKIFVQIRHFNDVNAYKPFLNNFYKILSSRILDEIKIPKKYINLLILLNSVYFVENTLNDLLFQVQDNMNKNNESFCDFENKTKEKIRSIEKIISSKIEKILKIIFNRYVKKKIQFSEEFIDVLKKEVFCLSRIEYNDSIIYFLIETLLSYLFNQISNLQMTSSRADIIISEIIEIKLFLKQNERDCNLINLIENYLKIFICTPDNPKDFVFSFVQLNQNIFNFETIIDALEDRSKKDILREEYKKQKQQIVIYDGKEEK